MGTGEQFAEEQAKQREKIYGITARIVFPKGEDSTPELAGEIVESLVDQYREQGIGCDVLSVKDGDTAIYRYDGRWCNQEEHERIEAAKRGN